MSLQISVIGSSEASNKGLQLAHSVGRELGKQGVTVVTGGLFGIMEAVSKGVKETGGTTVGILPGADPSAANQYVDIRVCTGIGYARNVVVVRSGLSVIAIEGAYGTLSEIAHALGDGIPVIGLDTWSFQREGRDGESMMVAKNPVEAANMAIGAAKERYRWIMNQGRNE